ncbi:ribonuclease P protein component [Patescibacteria group bacterium]|nr:ribonuclease P protein component [Patescibacteria group bacterium]
MLSRKHRINKSLFKEILKNGKNYNSDFFSLKIIHNFKNGPCFAFVVSKKTAKKAVARNKLKRRARYIVKKYLNSFKKNTANIIFFKKGSETMEFSELEKNMLELFKKTRIL